jgi:hypothetical protein
VPVIVNTSEFSCRLLPVGIVERELVTNTATARSATLPLSRQLDASNQRIPAEHHLPEHNKKSMENVNRITLSLLALGMKNDEVKREQARLLFFRYVHALTADRL